MAVVLTALLLFAGLGSALVEAILAQLPVLDFTAETARVHAGLFAALSRQGQMIGAHDLIIAATALARAVRCSPPTPPNLRGYPGSKSLHRRLAEHPGQ